MEIDARARGQLWSQRSEPLAPPLPALSVWGSAYLLLAASVGIDSQDASAKPRDGISTGSSPALHAPHCGALSLRQRARGARQWAVERATSKRATHRVSQQSDLRANRSERANRESQLSQPTISVRYPLAIINFTGGRGGGRGAATLRYRTVFYFLQPPGGNVSNQVEMEGGKVPPGGNAEVATRHLVAGASQIPRRVNY